MPPPAAPKKAKPEKTSGLLWLYIAAAVTIAIWFLVLSPLIEDVIEPYQAKHKNKWHSGRALAAAAAAAASPSAEAKPVDPRFAGAAYITLAGGDTSGRNCVALVQSLRDVGTVIPIVVLLVRGGLGSAACSNQTWKEQMNRTEIRCGSDQTIGWCNRSAGAPSPHADPLDSLHPPLSS